MYRIFYTKQAIKDKDKLKASGLDKKAKDLIDILRINPFQNPPRFEKLVGDLQGKCSRRINIQHRIVYQVVEEPLEKDGIKYDGYVKVLRMWTHYE